MLLELKESIDSVHRGNNKEIKSWALSLQE